MVDTADLAAAYASTVGTLRNDPAIRLKSRLLVMGNYWGGLHAQVRIMILLIILI